MFVKTSGIIALFLVLCVVEAHKNEVTTIGRKDNINQTLNRTNTADTGIANYVKRYVYIMIEFNLNPVPKISKFKSA